MKSVSVLRALGLVIGLALLILTGCRQEVDINQPPKIVYGQDACDRCQMLISEENMAAAYWTTDGEARRFDDIGGMLAYQRETGEEVAAWWVHDLTTGEWLKADDAHFVMEAGVATPMGFDIVAFADERAAAALAHGTESAMVMDFSNLRDQSVNPAMVHEDHQ